MSSVQFFKFLQNAKFFLNNFFKERFEKGERSMEKLVNRPWLFVSRKFRDARHPNV